jgi:asparagine synthase (glutamine-hydrolysing)
MCGFAGLIDPTLLGGGSIDRDALARMAAAVAPRGPDGQGFFHAPGVGFGHRRLKVIDLSDAAAQPMVHAGASAADSVVVVHNGEIYNFADLRAELQGEGHRFISRTDTEILLAGYRQWGDGLLDRITGMFAFALWDGPRRRLLCARDRMGKKPLYFAQLPRAGAPPLFAFASELKALVQAPGFSRALDPAGLSRYLVHEYVPPPHTIFAAARKLDAGESLVLELGADLRAAPTVHRYWRLPLPAQPARVAAPQAAADLWTLLLRAVERRLVGDVPLGIFLSGGIDSAAVAAAATQLAGPVATFSIGFSEPSFDESPHARAVARHLGSHHHEERLEASRLLDLLPDVARLLDEPLADASIVPTLLLCRFARQHVTVALGGDGGDELFAGYPTFAAERLAGWLLDRAPAVTTLLDRAAAALPAREDYFSLDFKLRQLARGGRQAGPVRHQRWLGAFVPEELPALLAPDFPLDPHTFDPLAEVRALAAQTTDPSARLLDFYTRFYLANDVNVKVDRAAGASGLEVRAPLLDHDLVHFACLLPPHLRDRVAQPKFLLKRALRGRLPDAIIDRKKQGFAIPVARWLKSELRPLLLDELGEDKLRREGLFAPAAVAALVNDHLSGRHDRRKQLWTLLSFQRWRAAWASPG